MNQQVSPSSPSPRSSSAPSPSVPAAEKKKKYRFDLSSKAARMIFEKLRQRKTPDAALRVGVRGGGCSGMSYVLEFSDQPARSRDLVFTFDVERKPSDQEDPGKVQIYCDKKSILYLSDSMLDWEQTLIFQGFKFVNPHEKSSCGCNSSFSV